jgi:hypothetical protein
LFVRQDAQAQRYRVQRLQLLRGLGVDARHLKAQFLVIALEQGVVVRSDFRAPSDAGEVPVLVFVE